MNEIVTVIAHARAKPGEQERAREILEELVGPSRAEEGCINYDLHQSVEHPDLFVFHENWTSLDVLEAHAKSAHIQRFRKKLSEILEEPPIVSRWRRLM
jgi:quinol monooxygenase YgiN